MNGLLSLSVSDLTALKEALRTGRVHAPFLPTLIERIVPRAVSGDVSAALQAMAAAGTNREGLVAALELLAAARAQQPSIDEVIELVTTGPEAGTVTNLKRHGRIGITRELPLPERITPLVKVYRHEELAHFFAACSDAERALFATFLLSGFREQEVMYLNWSDIDFELRTVRVTAKPNLGFYPKRWEDREVPAPVELLEELRKLTHQPNCQFVFPSPTGNPEQHMLDHCKSIAMRAKLDPTRFDLKTFRSTYATEMLRRGFDVRTVQHWMGHKSLETTMRYLAPANDVHDEVDLVTIPSIGKAEPALRKSAVRETRSSRKADQG